MSQSAQAAVARTVRPIATVLAAMGMALADAGAQQAAASTLPSATVASAGHLARAGRVAQAARVGGMVYDSLRGAPLPGAWVQLRAADDAGTFGVTVRSDSLGRFIFREVPSGRYAIGFHHPKLDSLGLAPVTKTLTIAAPDSVDAFLAVPSPSRIRSAVCGAGRDGSVLMGYVRHPLTGEPVEGATVSGEWLEYSLSKTGLAKRTPRRTVTTQADGWFAICGVPSPGIVAVRAGVGGDSTDLVEAQITDEGFMRRELLVGAGTTTLRGVVRRADSQRPLADAEVRFVNGPSTRTNDKGEWVLPDAPVGTRLVDVRAVGYFPERQTLDVRGDMESLTTDLNSLKSVLDTVKTVALYPRYTLAEDIKERARSTSGIFMTFNDPMLKNAMMVSDALSMTRGVFVDRGLNGPGNLVTMRGMFTPRCSPLYVVNGFPIPGFTTQDLDSFYGPNNIFAIEIYHAGTVPAQFQVGMQECGSIVVWTR
ncbi:MAG: carboxypeptidase regulatory-like domain-containing protein [Gemmatimonadaceae bacterium]|nr:carboxypeptidase regulatory-like domain-containing protein [Gemmatimonadaceae bacterium]